MIGLALEGPPRLASPEIDSALNRIDNWNHKETEGLAIGSFSVFAAANPANLSVIPGWTSARQSPGEPSSNPPSEPSPDNYRHPGSETLSQIFAASGIGLYGSVPLPEVLQSQNQDDHNAPAQDPHGSARHLDVLTIPSKQKRLIHHWITFTSRKLVLIDEPQNPCRTLMLPMALQGLTSSSSSSNADVAIFHALCASAAYNLYELGGRSCEEDHVLALYHDQQAIHHLRHNLAETNAHRAQSVAMAIMACIAVEAISGTTQRWRTHVSGGLAYLARLYSQGVSKELLSAFRHHMVKMAILCDVSVPADLKSFLHDESDVTDLEFTFPYYGVSRSFLRRQDYVNSLIASSSQSDESADAFELQMYLDFPSIPPPGLSCTSNETHSSVVHHASKAFYYAQLVYYQRSVRGSPLSTVQDLVELGVIELECLERHVASGELGCVMLWPALILGSESGTSSIQARMSSWFRSQARLGFRNLVILEDLIGAVWKARSDDDADDQYLDWRKVDAHNPAQFDVFRL